MKTKKQQRKDKTKILKKKLLILEKIGRILRNGTETEDKKNIREKQDLIKIGFDFGINAKEHHKKCKYCKYCYELGRKQTAEAVKQEVLDKIDKWKKEMQGMIILNSDIEELKQEIIQALNKQEKKQ